MDKGAKTHLWENRPILQISIITITTNIFFAAGITGRMTKTVSPTIKTAGGGLLPITQILIGSQKPRAMRGALPSDKLALSKVNPYPPSYVPPVAIVARGTHTKNQSTGRRPENRKRSRKETARNDTAASGGAVPAPQRGRVAGCQIKIAWWNTDAARRGDIPCFPVGRYHGKQHGCDRPTDRPTGRF